MIIDFTKGAMTPKLRRTQLGQHTRFNFPCKRCLLCCHGKNIQVNPYEVARLAYNLRMSTTDFIANHTTAGGTLLNWAENSACIFLDTKGCAVHKDRPLVCRLYPLGRHVSGSGKERFSELEPHAGCQGLYGTDITIREYLGEQGTVAFIEAADRYLSLFRELLEMIQKQAASPLTHEPITREIQNFTLSAASQSEDWMDMDAAVGAYCREARLAFPDNIEEKMQMHLKTIKTWSQLTKGGKDEAVSKAGKAVPSQFRQGQP